MSIKAKKSLGQNFLIDKNIIYKIVDTAGDMTDCTAIEIGIGTGNLTRALLETEAVRVIGLEKDSRCVEHMQGASERLEIQEGDALEVDISQLAEGKKKVVANLPYNIATTLTVNWMEYVEAFESLTLMFQKEVAERIVAAPHTKAYGRVSVLVQALCQAKKVFDIPPQAFRPQPKIMSSVVHITPKYNTLNEDGVFAALKTITRVAFSQRRKMVRSTFKGLNCDHLALLAQVGIPETARAEEIPVEQFCELARAYIHSIKHT